MCTRGITVSGGPRRRRRSGLEAPQAAGARHFGSDRRGPAHVEEWKGPAVGVDRRAADDDEAERLVEAARGGVLLVDVDGQLAAAQRLSVLDEPAAATPSPGRRLEEQRC